MHPFVDGPTVMVQSGSQLIVVPGAPQICLAPQRREPSYIPGPRQMRTILSARVWPTHVMKVMSLQTQSQVSTYIEFDIVLIISFD